MFKQIMHFNGCQSKSEGHAGSPSDVGAFFRNFHLELHPLTHHGVNVIQQLGDGDWRL